MDSKQRSDNKRFRMYGKILYKPPHQRKKCKQLRGSALLTTPFKSNRYCFIVLDQGWIKGGHACVSSETVMLFGKGTRQDGEQSQVPGECSLCGSLAVSSCPANIAKLKWSGLPATLMELTCIGLGSKEKILNMLCRK